MTLLGIDVSHWQGQIDWPKVKASGHHFALLKATESTNYTDPTFARNRAAARAAGLTTGAYHFARYQDPIAEADRFCNAVGALASGEIAVLDWEIDAADPVSWSRRWLDRVRERLGVRAFVYMNQFHRSKWAWKQIADLGHPLWLAKYDGNQDQPPGGPWPATAMKQFTDKGKVPGIAGGVDLNVFYGDLKALAKYGKDGNDLEDDMPDINEISVVVRDWSTSAVTSPTIDWGTHKTSVAQQTADNAKMIVTVQAQLGALIELVRQVAEREVSGGVDLAAIEAAAKRGADEALDGFQATVVVSHEPTS